MIKYLFLIIVTIASHQLYCAESSSSSHKTKKKKGNLISKTLAFDKKAAEYMKEKNITAKEVKKVLLFGRRITSEYGNDIKVFKERNSKKPLIVLLDRSEDPNTVLHVNKGNELKSKELIFSKHASDRMAERYISEESIHEVIANGNRFYDKKHDSIMYRSVKRKLPIEVVLSTDEKVVITVIREDWS